MRCRGRKLLDTVSSLHYSRRLGVLEDADVAVRGGRLGVAQDAPDGLPILTSTRHQRSRCAPEVMPPRIPYASRLTYLRPRSFEVRSRLHLSGLTFLGGHGFTREKIAPLGIALADLLQERQHRAQAAEALKRLEGGRPFPGPALPFPSLSRAMRQGSSAYA